VEQNVFHCEQCGAPYLAGVTICYSCGAAIGDAEDPTKPVSVPVHLRARTATVPMSPVVPASSVSANAAPPRLPWRQRIDTRVRPLSAVLLGFSLLLVVAGLLVLNQRLIPAQVPASNVYRDPTHRFHVTQPALWQAAPYAGGVVFSDATGVTQVLINVAPDPYGETAPVRAEALRQALGLSAASDVVASSLTWSKAVGTVTSASGAESEMLVLVSQRGDSLYIVECTSPAASFDANMRLVFLPLVHSLAIG
jgi:hypothetical protein